LTFPHNVSGCVKLFADGSLGARTALLDAPYSDKTDTSGVEEADSAFLTHIIKKCTEQGMQVSAHAIGDKAVERVVTAIEKSGGGSLPLAPKQSLYATPSAGGAPATPPQHGVTDTELYPVQSTGSLVSSANPLRHGVIHCQITSRGLLERMAKANIPALIQPIFLNDDLYMLEDRVGRERAATSYAWGTMEKLGIRTAYGTDCPVCSLNPLLNIQCAVTRQNVETLYPRGGQNPKEKVDVYTAVDAYTKGSAYANFDEHRVGRIAPGYLADIIMLDKNIFEIPPETIKTAKVLMTVLGGGVVYKSDER
jgi:predicted amidohydrolase YtcJ